MNVGAPQEPDDRSPFEVKACSTGGQIISFGRADTHVTCIAQALEPSHKKCAPGDSIMEKENGMVIQLGVTPRYLDPRCHERLYEIDMGVNERRDRPNTDAALTKTETHI